MPQIIATGGATVMVPTTGNQPPYLLVADEFQPPTWVVGTIPGGTVRTDPMDADKIYRLIHDRSWGIMPRFTPSPYTGIGFWAVGCLLYVDGVETYTIHEMAVTAAKLHRQLAIYNLQTGETEFMEDMDSVNA